MGFEQMPRYRHCGGDICVSIRGWCFSPNPLFRFRNYLFKGLPDHFLILYAQYLHRTGSSRRVSQACTSRLSYRLRVGFRRTAWSVNCFPTVEEFTRRALPKPRRVATVEPIAD